jgi:hypothetical protein
MCGPSKCAIIIFWGATNLYKKINNLQQQFLEVLVLYICKGYMAFSSCEMFGYGVYYYKSVCM